MRVGHFLREPRQASPWHPADEVGAISTRLQTSRASTALGSRSPWAYFRDAFVPVDTPSGPSPSRLARCSRSVQWGGGSPLQNMTDSRQRFQPTKAGANASLAMLYVPYCLRILSADSCRVRLQRLNKRIKHILKSEALETVVRGDSHLRHAPFPSAQGATRCPLRPPCMEPPSPA